jgi:hypothetical protein
MNRVKTFGIKVEFLLLACAGFLPARGADRPSWSAFPVVMYDSDIGVGFGGKAVLKNRFRRDESFDLILFGSSKGEQWTVFAFSVPDFEIRQGKLYALAFDLNVEYDKLLKSNFFGIGNDSRDNDLQFPREFIKLEAVVSRAVTGHFIGEIGARVVHYSSYGYEPAWRTITSQIPGAGETSVGAIAVKLRFDTRDSRIHPRRGVKLDALAEKSERLPGSKWNFTRARTEASAYRTLFSGNDILAIRIWSQHITGNAPYEELSKIGDSWTGRGYKADRFLDKAMALASVEYRFPVFLRIGGVVFSDAGRVWPSLSRFGFRGWHADGGLGLRYTLENFVVRLDLGRSPEGTRVFFNFGQVF